MTAEFSLTDYSAMVGKDLGTSSWLSVDQDRIDRFADVTGDRQWIHVDHERSRKGPFGTTIAHGFLTASLLPVMLGEIYRVTGVAMTLNYGLNRLRFPAPVRVGSRLRTTAHLLSLESAGAMVQSVVRATVDIDGEPKPACVAEVVTRIAP